MYDFTRLLTISTVDVVMVLVMGMSNKTSLSSDLY